MAPAATARPDEDVEEMASEDRPIPVKRDYTHKPQKPITLKPSIADEQPNAVSWTQPPGKILGSTPQDSSESSAPEAQPVRATVEWTLRDISPDVRDEAIRIAELEEISVGEWVDRVLGEVLFESIPPEEIVGGYEEPYDEYEEGFDEEHPYEVSQEVVEQIDTPGAGSASQQPPATEALGSQVPERPRTGAELQTVLQEISDRLSALEQRRTVWDTVRGLLTGK